MVRASLCPSSGEQECALPHMVFCTGCDGCGCVELCAVWKLLFDSTVTSTVHTVRVPAPHNHSHHNQCRTPYATVHTPVLLMLGIMMHETCWDKSLIINIKLVASCWFLSLQTGHIWFPYTKQHHPLPQANMTYVWHGMQQCFHMCLYIFKQLYYSPHNEKRNWSYSYNRTPVSLQQAGHKEQAHICTDCKSYNVVHGGPKEMMQYQQACAGRNDVAYQSRDGNCKQKALISCECLTLWCQNYFFNFSTPCI